MNGVEYQPFHGVFWFHAAGEFQVLQFIPGLNAGNDPLVPQLKLVPNGPQNAGLKPEAKKYEFGKQLVIMSRVLDWFGPGFGHTSRHRNPRGAK